MGVSLDHVLYAVVPSLQQQVTDAAGTIASLTQRVQQLEQELAAAQAQPPVQAPPPPPPAPDPFGEACKAVVRELAAAITLAG